MGSFPDTNNNMKKILLLFILSFSTWAYVQAQCEINPATGMLTYPDGTKCPNAIPTAVPFLSITPDARSGAMGDAGIAISGDANAIAYKIRSEEHTSELQSRVHLVCRLLLEKK